MSEDKLMEKSGRPRSYNGVGGSEENHNPGDLHIAVTGRPSSGKSSLVNALRNVMPGDPAYAPIGLGSGHQKSIQYYPFDAGEKHFKLVDLPGIDCPAYPSSEYAKRTDFTSYPAVIICSCERFSENDLMLAKMAHDSGAFTLMVRTKIDNDIDNDKDDYGDDHNEQTLLMRIRADMKKQLDDHQLGEINVYLVSNRPGNRQRWDLPGLLQVIRNNGEYIKNIARIKYKKKPVHKGPAATNEGFIQRFIQRYKWPILIGIGLAAVCLIIIILPIKLAEDHEDDDTFTALTTDVTNITLTL